MPTAFRVGSSTESATRGSRRMFFSFCWSAPRWPQTSSSPSTPTHTHATCGLPSRLRVTRCARAPASIAERASAGSSAMPGLSQLEGEQVVDRLALADQPRAAVADENGGGPRDDVVRRAHRKRVGAGHGHREDVASLRLRQRDPLDEDVARLAVLPGDRVGAGRLRIRPLRDDGGVARAVQRRPRVVGHAAVDRDVGGIAGDALDGADTVERDAGTRDERAPGLEDHPRQWKLLRRESGLELAEHAADELVDGDLRLAGNRADAEAAPEVDDTRPPAGLVACAGCERRELRDA